MRIAILLSTVTFAACSGVPRDQRTILRLSIDDFNASGFSWRALESRGDFISAAKLIEAYLAQNAARLPEHEATLAWFHAAQMRAFAGDSEAALKHLRFATFKIEPATWPVPWNDYVSATSAFLRRDRETLLQTRTRIAADPRWTGRVAPSLNFVDSLIEHFDSPYLEAYSRTRPEPNKAPEPTSTAVTPRAYGKTFRMKLQNLLRDAARGAPAAAVAHL